MNTIAIRMLLNCKLMKYCTYLNVSHGIANTVLSDLMRGFYLPMGCYYYSRTSLTQTTINRLLDLFGLQLSELLLNPHSLTYVCDETGGSSSTASKQLLVNKMYTVNVQIFVLTIFCGLNFRGD